MVFDAETKVVLHTEMAKKTFFFIKRGSPCVLAIFFFPPLESYAVMATLFPLFVLTATVSEVDQLINSETRKWLGAGLGRLPVFYFADTISMNSQEAGGICLLND